MKGLHDIQAIQSFHVHPGELPMDSLKVPVQGSTSNHSLAVGTLSKKRPCFMF